eukprot:64445_1
MHMNESISNGSISPTYQLWKSTRINPNNLSTLHLYVPRKDKKGTYPISIQPYQYLSKLREYNISIGTLNIPTSCPHFENVQANTTSQILFNIIKSQTQPLFPANVQEYSNENENLHKKLDWIMNMLEYKDIQTTMKYLHVANETTTTNTTNSTTRYKSRRKRKTFDNKTNNYVPSKRQRVIKCYANVQEINGKKPTKELLWELKVCTLKLQHLKPHGLPVKGPKWFLIDEIYGHYENGHPDER